MFHFFLRYHEKRAKRHKALAHMYYRRGDRHWAIYKQSEYWTGEAFRGMSGPPANGEDRPRRSRRKRKGDHKKRDAFPMTQPEAMFNGASHEHEE